jgi:hypothetical protein
MGSVPRLLRTGRHPGPLHPRLRKRDVRERLSSRDRGGTAGVRFLRWRRRPPLPGRAAWEIWNEPNLPQWWAGAPDPAAYVALARVAAAEIRKSDPRAWILGPSLGGGTFDSPYLEATFELGLLDIVDAVSLHPYGAPHPEAAEEFYAEVRRRMARHGRTLPIVVSEWGYPVEGLGSEGQADYLLRALAVNRKAGIPLTIWYNWQEPITPWHSFGLLDVRGQPKPAYRALARDATQSSPSRGPR